jgi:hypothetical protein
VQVAECLRLGFSTHQTSLTDISWGIQRLHSALRGGYTFYLDIPPFTSPFLCALRRGSSEMLRMLYDSGSASNKEVLAAYQAVLQAQDCSQQVAEWKREGYEELWKNTRSLLPELENLATTPRSLQSLSRQVISHCLDPRRRLHIDVQSLPVLSTAMKSYVMFAADKV